MSGGDQGHFLGLVARREGFPWGWFYLKLRTYVMGVTGESPIDVEAPTVSDVSVRAHMQPQMRVHSYILVHERQGAFPWGPI
jgi:hypothetical protein